LILKIKKSASRAPSSQKSGAILLLRPEFVKPFLKTGSHAAMIFLTPVHYLFYSSLQKSFFINIFPYFFNIIESLNMLSIEQFRYGNDNFAYLVHGKKQAMAIDGGAWETILSFLKANQLALIFVTNTHDHYDHTSGNEFLLKNTAAEFLKASNFPDHHEMMIDGEVIRVFRTPGHTNDSVCFYTGHSLISGDTLFNGTVGNCFSGNLNDFYLSLKRLMALPDETKVFAGHDYVLNSLAFSGHLEPDNRDIAPLRISYGKRKTLYTTMAEERRVNPYLRFNEESIIDTLRKNNLPFATEKERWHSLMSIE